MNSKLHLRKILSNFESDGKTHIYVFANSQKEIVTHYLNNSLVDREKSLWFRAGEKIAFEICLGRFRGGLAETAAYIGFLNPTQKEELMQGFIKRMEAEISQLLEKRVLWN